MSVTDYRIHGLPWVKANTIAPLDEAHVIVFRILPHNVLGQHTYNKGLRSSPSPLCQTLFRNSKSVQLKEGWQHRDGPIILSGSHVDLCMFTIKVCTDAVKRTQLNTLTIFPLPAALTEILWTHLGEHVQLILYWLLWSMCKGLHESQDEFSVDLLLTDFQKVLCSRKV